MTKSFTPTGDRAHLLQIARTVRDQAGPKVARMIERLCEEAETAERDTARVTAARAVVSFAVESAKLAHELESGEAAGSGGTSVTIMIATPNQEPRIAKPDEMKHALTALSESVRAELGSGKK